MGSVADGALVDAVREALAAAADPVKAGPMQRYMKSAMPYRGIQSPDRRALVAEVLALHPLTDRATWEATARELWDDAEFREERYAATQLTGHRSARAWQDAETLDLYRHMIITGAWWDHVDEIASKRVGPIFRAHRDEVGAVLRGWAVGDDLWLRRTAIICQLGAREDLDLALLEEVIEANLPGPRAPAVTQDFFIRKAIGWALREHAKTDPAWVRAYVDHHRERLSPLSYREATKHL